MRTRLCRWLMMAAVFLPASLYARNRAQRNVFTVLKPADYHHYIEKFDASELAATHQTAPDEWPWLVANIPFFSSSNKQFEEMYYFRWFAWEKHLVHTKDYGYLITEWLPKPQLENYGVLPDAAPFHLGEARWLRNPQIAEDYARYWISPGARASLYSFALATSVRDVTLATGNTKLGSNMLPVLIANYKAWLATQFDPSVGLFWSIDTRDAMEKSISGDGYRPTLNSYMVGDTRAIADFARTAGKPEEASSYQAKADTLEHTIETKLWNPEDQFYEVVSPAADSGIRKQKKFKNNGTVLKFAGVRELIGYIPWEYYKPTPSHDVAWKELFDPEGFAGKYGPTTAERRSSRFRFPSSDQCTWNGPSWPYATTQTLLALANLLNGEPQPYIGKQQYYRLFSNYVRGQHLKLADGRTIDWIDEDLDADTDEWIAKDMLIKKHKQVGRGNYYNHSGFADPLITGLIGLRPRADRKLILHPLLPPGEWSYFSIDGLPYHGHLLTIIYDETGKHYHRGRGLTVYVDGKKLAHRPTLGPLKAELPN
jgi:Mannosylglycerate hydrolase MGH1-like glycoside hydrolase domain/Glycosyl hydrolase family 65, C-terminal domain